jgi:hypothetical protein
MDEIEIEIKETAKEQVYSLLKADNYTKAHFVFSNYVKMGILVESDWSNITALLLIPDYNSEDKVYLNA